MNSKQRRTRMRWLEQTYGAELTRKVATSRVLGEAYVSLGYGVPMPDTWPLVYIMEDRYQVLHHIDKFARK